MSSGHVAFKFVSGLEHVKCSRPDTNPIPRQHNLHLAMPIWARNADELPKKCAPLQASINDKGLFNLCID
jgi:hypothetical protein